MKKILGYLLVFVICLSNLCAYAEDEEDVGFKPGDEYKDGIKYEDDKVVFAENSGGIFYSDVDDYSAVGILGTLRIMEGAEENLFKPNVIISRVDFLEGLLKVMQIDCSQPMLKEQKVFYDVEKNYEKASVVYQGVNNSIISGYSDNSFRPNNSITYEEAIICAVRALGYGNTEIFGTNYKNIASKINLTKGLSISNYNALTRMDMAKILKNVLETPMCNMSLSGGSLSYTTDGETPLNHYWSVYYDEGVVETNNLTSLSGNANTDNAIVINNKSYRTLEKSNFNLLGYLVNYYYDEDDNLIYAYKSNNVIELIINADDEPLYAPSQMEISYVKGSSRKKAKLRTGYKLLYNGIDVKKSYTTDIFSIKNGTIRLISNNSGNTYEYVFIEEYNDVLINSASFNESSREISFELGSDMGAFKINVDDTYVEVYDHNGTRADIYRITDSGQEKIDISAIKKNSVLSIFSEYGCVEQKGTQYVPTKDTRHIKIIVSQNTIEGKITRISLGENTISIDETEYLISNSSWIDTTLLTIGENKKFFLNYDSRIVECQEGKTGWKYYYIVKPKFSRDQELVNIEVFTTAGNLETYTVAEKYKLNGKKVKQDGTIKGKLRDSAQMINPTFEYQQLVKMQLNENDEITEIQTVTKSTGIDSGYSKDHLQRSMVKKTYNIWTDAKGVLCDTVSSALGLYFQPKIYFTVPSTEQTDRTYFQTGSITDTATVLLDLYDIDDLTPNVAVQYKDAASDAAIVVGYGAKTDATVMLDRAWLALDEYEDVVLKILIAQMGTKKEYFSYDRNLLDGYEQGDLLRIYGYGNEITKVEPVLYDGKVVGPNNLPPITGTDPISINNFSKQFKVFSMQVYKVLNDSDFIVQCGSIVNGLIREQQSTCCIRNKEWQAGGVLVYNYTGEARAEVRQGTIADLRSVVADGMSNASIVLFAAHYGGASQLVIYNLK